MKKLLSLITVLLLVATLVPAAALADTADAFTASDGTSTTTCGSLADALKVVGVTSVAVANNAEISTAATIPLGVSVTFSGSATIASGCTLTFDSALSVPSGFTLTNNGTLTANGGITVNGTLENDGTIGGSGAITVNGTLNNDGTISAGNAITVNSKCSMANAGIVNSTITNYGELTNGGKINANIVNVGDLYNMKSGYINATVFNNVNGYILTYSGNYYKITDNGGSVQYFDHNNTDYNDYYTITVSAGKGGTAYPSGSFSVKRGSDSGAIKITPEAGYEISAVYIDGVYEGTSSRYTIENVHDDHYVEIKFFFTGTTPSSNQYKIEISATAGGTVSPTGTMKVTAGKDSDKVTITPDSGYTIGAVYVDGEAIEIASAYTFPAVAANHTMQVMFIKAEGSTGNVQTPQTGDGAAIMVLAGFAALAGAGLMLLRRRNRA